MASLYGDLPPPGTKSKDSKDNDHSSTLKSSNTNSSQSQTKIGKLYNFSPPVKSTLKSIKKPIIPGMKKKKKKKKKKKRKKPIQPIDVMIY